MITEIKKIKKFGIFEDYTKGKDNLVSPFKRYNLIYGWNGSGKTTLSKLFCCLEKKDNPYYPDSQFEFQTETGTINQTYVLEPPKIHVFNEDFVKNNTTLEQGKTKSLLYLAKDAPHLTRRKEALVQQIEGVGGNGGLKDSLKEKKQDLDTKEKEQSKFLTNCGSQLKTTFLSTIFPNPNIDKKLAESIWNQVKTSPTQFILQDKEYQDKLVFIAQGKEPFHINITIPESSIKQYKDLHILLTSLLNENPANTSIARLKENPDLSKWVQQGLELHNNHNSSNCEFCNKPLSPERITELSNHFSDTFIAFQKRIENTIAEFKKLIIKPVDIDIQKLSPQFQETVKTYLSEYTSQKEIINTKITNEIELLQAKLQDPFSTYTQSLNDIDDITNFNLSVVNISQAIRDHNDLVISYKSTAEKYKNEIEKHIIAEKAKNENYQELLESISNTEKEISDIKTEIEKLTKEKTAIELDLATDQVAIEKINSDLHRFLSKNELVLERNTQVKEGGYLIKRNGEIARNLSEGEKTAIALVFFIVKLGEKDNDLSNSILVFDDPISSFDSNHLFSACTYITNNCEKAKQIFFLTHNFWFFKLIRDWLQRKNKNKEHDKKPEVGNFYTIKKGIIANAPKSLTSYHSEYHFVFNKLLELQKQDNFTLEEAFSVANFARRVLEAFNAFKTHDNSGFQGIIQNAIRKGIPQETTDKVYYFVNKYSHLDRIETLENTIENVEAESSAIINGTLKIIETIDSEHYESMLKACQ